MMADNINIDENLYYLHEKLKLLNSHGDYQLDPEFYSEAIFEDIKFIVNTVSKIEDCIDFEKRNKVTLKFIRSSLNLRNALKDFLIESKSENIFDTLDCKDYIDSAIDIQNKRISFLINSLSEYDDLANDNFFTSNEEINLLLT